ncbi:MAG: hypothetical protein WAQ27_05635 [Candidatus Microsaccharimonas sp.]
MTTLDNTTPTSDEDVLSAEEAAAEARREIDAFNEALDLQEAEEAAARRLADSLPSHLPLFSDEDEWRWPVEIGRFQAGLIMAGLACGVTQDDATIAGAIVRVQDDEDIANIIHGLRSSKKMGASKAVATLSSLAGPYSVGIPANGRKRQRRLGRAIRTVLQHRDGAFHVANILERR